MKKCLNEWVQEELKYATSKVKENMNDFYDKVLPATSRENRFYPEDAEMSQIKTIQNDNAFPVAITFTLFLSNILTMTRQL